MLQASNQHPNDTMVVVVDVANPTSNDGSEWSPFSFLSRGRLILPTVYVAAAKARKARMTERGAEVEKLMSLAGTPLLVDMSVNADADADRVGASGGPMKKSAPRNAFQDDDDEAVGSGGGDRASERTADAADEQPGDGGGTGSRSRNEAAGAVRTNSASGVAGSAAEAAAVSHGGRGGRNDSRAMLSRSASEPGGALDQNQPKDGSSAVVPIASTRSPSPRELDAARVLATASTPQLPCFSLGSSPQLSLRTAGGGDQLIRLAGRDQRHGGGALSSNVHASSPATNGMAVLSAGYGPDRARHWARPNVSERAFGEALTSRQGGQRRCSEEAAGRAAAEARAGVSAAAARDRASALLAAHLTPFPTITKNRSLHAVAQPIVKHSEGFADACRGDRSRSGTAAWRVAREARFDGLVAPADRLSIARQIEAGFDVLQGRNGRRVSPVA